GFRGLPEHSLMIGGKPWGWMGAGNFFLRGFDWTSTTAAVAVWFGILAASLAAVIPLGSGADRWKLGPSLICSAITGAIVFPLFAHWSWGAGWLAQLGKNYSLGIGFMDAGGAASIQVIGGVTALSVSWILGPRRGKYAPGGMPAAIPGHNA